jgi:hypothetical protein
MLFVNLFVVNFRFWIRVLIPIRIQDSQIKADPDPGQLNQCGSGSRKANQINADPDPQHCLFGMGAVNGGFFHVIFALLFQFVRAPSTDIIFSSVFILSPLTKFLFSVRLFLISGH